jgi:hypothetical protein
VFYARRDDQQVKIPFQLQLGDPSSFLLVTANSERGEHYGRRSDARLAAIERIVAVRGCRLLRTRRSTQFLAVPELEGREQAHAPPYTYSLGAVVPRPSGWWGAVDLSGMDEFFFDYGHDR